MNFTFPVLNRSLIINFHQRIVKKLIRRSSCLFRLSMMLLSSSKSSCFHFVSLTDFAFRARHQASQQNMAGGNPVEPETEYVVAQFIQAVSVTLRYLQRANPSSFARSCQHIRSHRAAYLSHPSWLIFVSSCQWQHSRLLIRAWLGRVQPPRWDDLLLPPQQEAHH